MGLNPIFALVDCNSFYASCEILFRPKLKGRPVVVLSNNDGCAISMSKEAKLLGIKVGTPFFQFRDVLKREGGAYFSSNFALYGDMSSRVMKSLSELVPSIEIYSIDEAFLDLTGLTISGQYIKNKIQQHTGIPVSVGIAHTKVLAKLANKLAKKSEKSKGVVDLTNQRLCEIALKRTSIEDVWGIGSRSALKLKTLGINSANDFSHYQNRILIQKLLTKTGCQIQDELRGQLCLPLEIIAKSKQEILCSRSFPKAQSDISLLKEALANFAAMAAEKLRCQSSLCQTLTVFIRTDPFKDSNQYNNFSLHTFAVPTSDTRKIIRASYSILERIYKPSFSYKKLGIILSHLVDNKNIQLGLFEQGDSQFDQILMSTLDKVNKDEGANTLKILAQGTNHLKKNEEELWRAVRSHRSPSYTTRWDDLLLVK